MGRLPGTPHSGPPGYVLSSLITSGHPIAIPCAWPLAFYIALIQLLRVCFMEHSSHKLLRKRCLAQTHLVDVAHHLSLLEKRNAFHMLKVLSNPAAKIWLEKKHLMFLVSLFCGCLWLTTTASCGGNPGLPCQWMPATWGHLWACSTLFCLRNSLRLGGKQSSLPTRETNTTRFLCPQLSYS